MVKSPQLSSEEYHLEACCAYSAANLNMRYFVPPMHVQDSLKTLNAKSLEGSDVTTVQCPSLTCIEQCREQIALQTAILVRVERSRFVKTRLDSLLKEVDARLTRC